MEPLEGRPRGEMPALDDRIRVTVTRDELGNIVVALETKVSVDMLKGNGIDESLVTLHDRLEQRLEHERRIHG